MANPRDIRTALECGTRHLDRTPAGLQHVLAGAERAGQGDLARRKAQAPLRARAPQAPCDVGLFSDDAAQTDLIDMARSGTNDNP